MDQHEATADALLQQFFPASPAMTLDPHEAEAQRLLEQHFPQAPAGAMAQEVSGIAPLRTAAELSQPTRVVDPSMEDAALLRTIGIDPAPVFRSRFYRPGMLRESLITPGSFGEQVTSSPVGGVMHGVKNILDFGVQAGNRGLGAIGVLTPEDIALTDAQIKLKDVEYRQQAQRLTDLPWVGKMDIPATIGSAMVPLGRLAAPLRLAPESGTLANIGSNLLNATAAGATYSVAQPTFDPGMPGTANDTFWPQAWDRAKGGALAGAAFGAITAPVAAIGNKMWNASRNPTLSTTAATEERALQQAMLDTPWTNMADIDRAAAGGNKTAINLQQSIGEAGSDWQKIVQTSGGVQLFKNQLLAQGYYADVAQLAAPVTTVPIGNTLTAIDKALTKLQGEPLADKATIATLQRMRVDLSPTSRTVTTPPGPGQPLNAQPTTAAVLTPADTSYMRLRDLRKKINDLIADYYHPHGNALVADASIGHEGIMVLPQIQQTLENDMARFAPTNVTAAAKKADQFYETSVVPYHDRALGGAFKDSFSDELYQKFIKAEKGERAKYFYDALDPKGQAAIRFGMAQEAIGQATNGITGAFDTTKFTKYLQSRQDAAGVLFQGQAAWEMSGLGKLLAQTAYDAKLQAHGEHYSYRAGAIPLAGFLYSPEAGIVGTGLTALGDGAKLLMGTQRGRRFLAAASDLEPGSGAMQRLVDDLLKVMPRLAGAVEGAPTDAKRDVPSATAPGSQ